MFDELVLPLLLERDDDEGDKDIDEEEGEDDEIHDVEDGHLHAITGLGASTLICGVNGILQNSARIVRKAIYITQIVMLSERARRSIVAQEARASPIFYP